MIKRKLSRDWVVPECLKILKQCESILEQTEGVGFDILVPLADLIKKLENLELEIKAGPHDAA